MIQSKSNETARSFDAKARERFRTNKSLQSIVSVSSKNSLFNFESEKKNAKLNPTQQQDVDAPGCLDFCDADNVDDIQLLGVEFHTFPTSTPKRSGITSRLSREFFTNEGLDDQNQDDIVLVKSSADIPKVNSAHDLDSILEIDLVQHGISTPPISPYKTKRHTYCSPPSSPSKYFVKTDSFKNIWSSKIITNFMSPTAGTPKMGASSINQSSSQVKNQYRHKPPIAGVSPDSPTKTSVDNTPHNISPSTSRMKQSLSSKALSRANNILTKDNSKSNNRIPAPRDDANAGTRAKPAPGAVGSFHHSISNKNSTQDIPSVEIDSAFVSPSESSEIQKSDSSQSERKYIQKSDSGQSERRYMGLFHPGGEKRESSLNKNFVTSSSFKLIHSSSFRKNSPMEPSSAKKFPYTESFNVNLKAKKTPWTENDGMKLHKLSSNKNHIPKDHLPETKTTPNLTRANRYKIIKSQSYSMVQTTKRRGHVKAQEEDLDQDLVDDGVISAASSYGKSKTPLAQNGRGSTHIESANFSWITPSGSASKPRNNVHGTHKAVSSATFVNKFNEPPTLAFAPEEEENSAKKSQSVLQKLKKRLSLSKNGKK